MGIRRGRYQQGGRRVAGIFEVNLAFYWFIVYSVQSLVVQWDAHSPEVSMNLIRTAKVCVPWFASFHKRSSKFPAEHLSLLRNDLLPFSSPLFLRYSIFCQQLFLSVNIVVWYQFTVTCIENFASEFEVWGLSDGKKVQDYKYVFGSSMTFQRRKE